MSVYLYLCVSVAIIWYEKSRTDSKNEINLVTQFFNCSVQLQCRIQRYTVDTQAGYASHNSALSYAESLEEKTWKKASRSHGTDRQRPRESLEWSPGQTAKCQEDSSREQQEKLKHIKVQVKLSWWQQKHSAETSTKSFPISIAIIENCLVTKIWLKTGAANPGDMHFHIWSHLIVQ